MRRHRDINTAWRWIGQAALAALTAAASLFIIAPSTLAATQVDCPLRDAPYSIDTPMMDVLLKPDAIATLERYIPTLRQNLPSRYFSTEPPSFSAILTLRTASQMGLMQQDALARLDAELRALPITQADRNARCARYDVARPNIEIPSGGLRILLFEKITGYRDGPSVDAAHAALFAMAERNGWGIVATDRGGAITPSILRHFDLVIWNNISGDVLTLTQRRALQRYMEGGGGFVGVHGSGGDRDNFWNWYVETLIGARFMGHPMNPQFQEARVVITGADSAIGRDLAPGWSMTDEWYSFRTNPRASGSTIIATLDESTYRPEGLGADLRMGPDHPIAWSRCLRSGRVFYSAIGHRPETYTDPHYARLLEQAITWAGGHGETVCRSGREVPIQH